MKAFVYIFIAFWAVYLMFFGFAVGQIDNLSYEIFDVLNGSMVFFLAFDFITRLSFQEMPAQRLKPYKLMPVGERRIIDIFMIRTVLTPYNLFWLFFWVPFSLFAVMKFYGFWGFVLFNVGWVLLYAMNGLWYLLWRTLARVNSFIYLIPVAIYGILGYTGVLADFGHQWLFKGCMRFGRTFMDFNPLGMLSILIAMAVLFIINRKLQFSSVYDEISKVEKVQDVKSSQMA